VTTAFWPRLRTGFASSGGGRVQLLVAATAAAALALYLGGLHGLAPVAEDWRLPWWGIAIAFLVAEAYPIHLYFRSEAHSLSVSEVVLVLGLLFASPGDLLVGQLCGAALALLVVRRQRPLKAAFNLAEFALASCLALLVFHGLTSSGDVQGPAVWVAALAAAGAFALTGVVLVTVAIALTEGIAAPRELPKVAGFALAGGLASASVALAGLELIEVDPWSPLLLVLPAAICVVAFRAYGAERRRHAHVDFLYRSMRAMQDAPELRSALRELLSGARTMLSAEYAEIVLFEAGAAGDVLRTAVGPDGELLESAELEAGDSLALEQVSGNERALLLPRGREPHRLDAYLARHGLADAIVTALRRDDRVSGLLLVGNRAGDVSTFNADDRKVFETFASHAAVLLENDRVKEQLRHRAFHDDLTGLPNRVLFTQRVKEALARTDAAFAPTVLFVDLDDFKSINDNLGHTAGDELLVDVAARVRGAVRTGDMAARLGGDEFGVLLGTTSDGDAEHVARRIVDALRVPLVLHGRELLVHASIGIATGHTDTASADELLANADVAMYAAKAGGKRRYAFYEPRMHTRVRRRYELTAALETAIERNEISVHYQPIACLSTGRAVAVEALARWLHPRRGLVLPGSFVSLAEEHGLISPIGRQVLQEACRQAVEWQKLPGHEELSICVNLSPNELQNPNLTAEVSETLSGTGLAPECLILEVTERGAIDDHAATVAAMASLRRLGVRLALDDFGTGYSSLSHLRDFPIDILKIAKPFVDRVGGEAGETTLVDAILRLAHALDLEVVAEGIETAEQAEALRLLGCPLGQGYQFARPLDPANATERLKELASPDAGAWSRAA
jgi:diguanylate cyclase (GGDEF)-like protein